MTVRETPVGNVVWERHILDNKYFPVLERRIEALDGAERPSQLVWDRRGRQSAIAVTLDRNSNLVLVQEPKYGVLRLMTSAPTGGIKAGEHPLDAAKRELLEETGYASSDWRPVPVKPLVDFADKIDGGEHIIWCAQSAHQIKPPRDPQQRLVLASRERLFRYIMPSGNMPAMSIAAIMLTLEHFQL